MTDTLEPRTILIVEDEMDMRFFLMTLVTSGGFKAVMARNGKEGLQQAKTILPDAIVLDVMMPEEGGALMYRRLKTEPELARIPVIMLSGVSKRSFLHYLKMLNARSAVNIPSPQVYVEKPPEPQLLLTVLKDLFAKP